MTDRKPPRVGERVWHRSHEHRGKVLAHVSDFQAGDVLLVRFWFRRKQRWHYEVVPTWLLEQEYCPISKERPKGHAEFWRKR